MLTKILVTASSSWWDFSNFNFLHCLISFPFNFQIGGSILVSWGFPGGSDGKESTAMQDGKESTAMQETRGKEPAY